MKYRILNNIILYLILMMTTISLSSCSILQENIASSSDVSDATYNKGKIMIVLSSEKCHMQNKLTDIIWDTNIDDDHTKYSTIFMQEIKDNITIIKLIDRLAAQNGLEITDDESSAIIKAAERYITDINSTIDITKEDVIKVMSDYMLADKYYDMLISSPECEVSESDARVMDVQRIVLSDEKIASKVISMINDGEDFYNLAIQYNTKGSIETKISRQDLPQNSQTDIMSLSSGEISDIVRDGDDYYIYKCIKTYDEDATASNKQSLMTQNAKKIINDKISEYNYDDSDIINDEDFDEISQKFDEIPADIDYRDYLKDILSK